MLMNTDDRQIAEYENAISTISGNIIDETSTTFSIASTTIGGIGFDGSSDISTQRVQFGTMGGIIASGSYVECRQGNTNINGDFMPESST